MLLDIGLGILASLLTAKVFGLSLEPTLVIFGVAATLLPDIDTLLHLKGGGRIRGHKGHEHRDLLHYPLLYILLGSLAFSFTSWPYAFLFALGSFLHFLHDSIGIGWGVQWLYPFSRRYFAFFYHYDMHRNKLPGRRLYNWTPEEVDDLSERYGDKDWVRNIYLKWHPYAIAELMVFLTAVAILLWTTYARG